MIWQKMNLRCKGGHYHYSPTPEKFVGRSCNKPFESPLTTSGDVRRGTRKCYERMALCDPPKVQHGR